MPFLFRLMCCLAFLGMTSAAAQQQQPYTRFQYHNYKWRAFHTAAFHIYFPAGYDDLCASVAQEVSGAGAVIRKRMGTSFSAVPNIIIYPSVTQLYESNAGSFERKDVTLPVFIAKGNRLLLAYNGSYDDLKEQLYESLARAAWDEQLPHGPEEQLLKDQVPYWLKEGAIHYFAARWSIAAEDELYRIISSMAPQTWAAVIAAKPALAGQAFCYFLSGAYTSGTPAQLFLQLRKKKSLPRALRLITKTEVNDLYHECLTYYRERAARRNSASADTISAVPLLSFRPGKGRLFQVQSNRAGTAIAYTLSTWHQRTVYIYEAATRQHHKITTYRLPPWMNEHERDAYPLSGWTAGGNELLVVTPDKGELSVQHYSISGRQNRKEILPGIDGTGSIALTGGQDYLLSAWRYGQSDIVQYNVRRNKYTPLTSDTYDDRQPVFDDRTGTLFFVSKRPLTNDKKDTVSWQGIFSLRDRNITALLADTTDYIQWTRPEPAGSDLVATTTVHGLQQFARLQSPEHNNQGETHLSYGPAAQPGQYLPGANAILSYKITGDSLFLQQQPLRFEAAAGGQEPITPWLTDYRRAAAARAWEDSVLKAAADPEPSFLDGVFGTRKAAEQSARRKDSIRAAQHYEPGKSSPYILQLYSAYFMAKVNNDYFMNRYQPYQSYQGQFKFPVVGGMAQGGCSDLFENHHINIAFRLPAGSEGSDFFIKYLNTTRRLDWGLSYYRKSEDLQPDPLRNWVAADGRRYPNTAKVKTNYYELALAYPLTYFSSAHLTLAARQDKTVFLATEQYSLDFPAYKCLWTIAAASYQLDRLQPTLPLLNRGFSGRLSVDAFKGLTQAQPVLAGLSMKANYHLPLYRYITLVAQVQAGYSSGDHRILYNLGGVDNNITPRTDSTVHFSQSAPYSFQTLITPLRGYFQNSSYGSNYGLLNLDVYVPVFQTLVPVETPLSFINNFQAGLFTDVAKAGGLAGYSTRDQGWQAAFGCSARTTLAGYPIRFDVGWPGSFDKKPVWYLSLNTR